MPKGKSWQCLISEQDKGATGIKGSLEWHWCHGKKSRRQGKESSLGLLSLATYHEYPGCEHFRMIRRYCWSAPTFLMALALLWVSRSGFDSFLPLHKWRPKEPPTCAAVLWFAWCPFSHSWCLPRLNARSCCAFGSYCTNSNLHVLKEENMSEWATAWRYDFAPVSLPDTFLSSEMWKLTSVISGTVHLCEFCTLECWLSGRAGLSGLFHSLCITAGSSVTKWVGFCFVGDLAAYFCCSPLWVLW